MMRRFVLTVTPAAVGLLHACTACAVPAVANWPVEGPDDSVAVACASLSGWFAVADSFEDSVEIRDVNHALLNTITRPQIQALVPWINLTGGPDGPSGLAWSDSGRSLFVLVHGSALPGDGLGSDAVLRYDSYSGSLSVFARLELFDRDDQWPHLAAVHHRGRLFVGTASSGIKIYTAAAGSASTTLQTTVTLPGGGPVRGLSIDRENNLLFAASSSTLYRASASATSPTFTAVGSIGDIRSIALAGHFGASSNAGLYILTHPAALTAGVSATSTVRFVPLAQARGQAAFSPSIYLAPTEEWHALAFSADGRLFAASNEDAAVISESADTRLTYPQWLANEFQQQVNFAKGLISPNGEPPGWVIDADVQQGWSRFHPATPDAACWTILALLASDYVNSDPSAQAQVRQILVRYAGLAPDGIGASLSPDGFMRHWIDPLTGNTKPGGWSSEFATYSTMKIVVAADRAAAFYPNDDLIRLARNTIISNIKSWDPYIRPGTDEVYLISLPGGGPDTSVRNGCFTEGILFVEQAAAYGGASSVSSFARWINRSLWPTAQYIPGRSVTGDFPGRFMPAFITAYPLLLQKPFRNDPAWQSHTRNALESHAGWTDDNAPKYFTMFSAGTTRSDWGGYRADSLSDHPGNVTSFPALMAFAGTGQSHPAVSAYHAYRLGARQTFLNGASILYRRSDVDRAYQPNSAGLPDTVLGALGLAELLRPGTIDAVLARDFGPSVCPTDLNADGEVNTADLVSLLAKFGQSVPAGSPGDINGTGTVNTADLTRLLSAFGQQCP